jgi:hypothetical protein
LVKTTAKEPRRPADAPELAIERLGAQGDGIAE